jgi:hypothetical protein
MNRQWMLVLFGGRGARTRKVVVTKWIVFGLCALYLVAVAACLWLGWQVGDMTSRLNNGQHIETCA